MRMKSISSMKSIISPFLTHFKVLETRTLIHCLESDAFMVNTYRTENILLFREELYSCPSLKNIISMYITQGYQWPSLSRAL